MVTVNPPRVFDRQVVILYSSGRKLLIGLISDTHIDYPSAGLPPQVKEAFRGVDLILHAGDIWIPSVLDDLETVAPVMAAWGDDDMEIDLGNDARMMSGHSLLLDGVNIWLTHIKPRYGLINPNEMLYSFAFRPSSEDPVDPSSIPDVVVSGHTHASSMEYYKVVNGDDYKNILLVNPGSATFPGYMPQLGTVGMLTIDSGKVQAQIVSIK